MSKPSEDYRKIKTYIEVVAHNSSKIVESAKLVEVKATDPNRSVSEATLRFAREMVNAHRILIRDGNVRPALEVLGKRHRDLCDEYESLTDLSLATKLLAEELGEEPPSCEGVKQRKRIVQRSLRRLSPILRKMRRLASYYGTHGWFGGTPGDNFLLLLLGFDSEAALKESMEEIEGLLGNKLLILAEDESSLREAIFNLKVPLELHRRLVHADVLSSMVDDDWTLEVHGKREIVEYVLATHTLYRLLGVPMPLENSWNKSLFDLMPTFGGHSEESYRQQAKWIMRQHATTKVPPSRIQVLMKRLQLDLMTKSN